MKRYIQSGKLIQLILKLKQSNVLWSCIAVIINCAIGFLVIPYVASNIGVEAYGYVTLSNTIVTYVDIISIALNAFACRYIAISYHKKDFKKSSMYYSSIVLGDACLGFSFIIISLPLIINLQNILHISSALEHDIKILFIFVLVRYILTLIRNGFDVSTFIKNRIDISERLKSLSYVIQASILIILCMFFYPHVWYVGLASLVAAVFLLFAQIIVSNRLIPEIKIKIKYVSLLCIKDFVSIGIWNAINNLGNILNSGLDLLITNLMLSELAMGMVSISKTVGSICYTLITAISNSFRPKQLEAFSHNDYDELVSRLKMSMKITGSICAIIIGGFFACGREFISLWLPNQNTNEIYLLCIIVLMSDIMIGVVNPLYYVFTLKKKLRLPCYITLLMGATNILSMIVLIRKTTLAEYSVVLTTAVINCIHFLDTPLYASYCLKKPFRTFYSVIGRHFVNMFVLWIVFYLFGRLYPVSKNWFELFVKIFIAGIIGVICSLMIVLDKKERDHYIFNRIFLDAKSYKE